MRSHITGVCAVTLASPHGPYGITVNSFTSLSLDPPLISFAIADTLGGHPLFHTDALMAVHILTATQASLAEVFARRGIANRFDLVDWQYEEHGIPILSNALVTLVASIESTIAGGDHDIIIGRVMQGWSATAISDLEPLIFYRGHFHSLKECEDCEV